MGKYGSEKTRILAYFTQLSVLWTKIFLETVLEEHLFDSINWFFFLRNGFSKKRIQYCSNIRVSYIFFILRNVSAISKHRFKILWLDKLTCSWKKIYSGILCVDLKFSIGFVQAVVLLSSWITQQINQWSILIGK